MTTYEAYQIEKKLKNNEKVTNKEMELYKQKKLELNKKLFGNKLNEILQVMNEKCMKLLEGGY